MPLDETIKYSDLRTLKRIETVNNSSNVLMYFFKKRFQNFDALKAIVLHFFILRLMKSVFGIFSTRQVE
jgi:hypothetical protein